MLFDLERTIYITGDIESELAEQVVDDMLKLDLVSNDPIYLILCTEGGCMYSMFAIHDVMCSIRSPVYTVALGKVMSAGALLLSAGDKRLTFPHSCVMIHEAQAIDLGNQGLAELKSEMLHTEYLNNQMIELLAKYSGQEVEKVVKDLHKEKCLYLSAKEAIAYGLIDELVEPVRKANKKGRSTT